MTPWCARRRVTCRPSLTTGRAAREHAADVDALLESSGAQRIVVTGNGASLHACLAMWQLACGGPSRLSVPWDRRCHVRLEGACQLLE